MREVVPSPKQQEKPMKTKISKRDILTYGTYTRLPSGRTVVIYWGHVLITKV